MSVAIATMGKFLPSWAVLRSESRHPREEEIIKPKIIVNNLEMIFKSKGEVFVKIIGVKNNEREVNVISTLSRL
jgi:hypothetical protein